MNSATSPFLDQTSNVVQANLGFFYYGSQLRLVFDDQIPKLLLLHANHQLTIIILGIFLCAWVVQCFFKCIG